MGRTDRRGFLKQGLVAAGGLGLGLTAWSRLGRHGASPGIHPALGPLLPVNDQTTGLPLLMLPQGYRYRSMAWAGEKLNDGYPSPGACDGMGVVAEEAGIVIEGEIEITVADQVKVMRAGEGYIFDSRLPHRFRNFDDDVCEIISSCTPPSF